MEQKQVKMYQMKGRYYDELNNIPHSLVSFYNMESKVTVQSWNFQVKLLWYPGCPKKNLSSIGVPNHSSTITVRSVGRWIGRGGTITW